jgi:hypothetical protein
MTLLVDCQYSIALPMPLPGVIFMPAATASTAHTQ